MPQMIKQYTVGWQEQEMIGHINLQISKYRQLHQSNQKTEHIHQRLRFRSDADNVCLINVCIITIITK